MTIEPHPTPLQLNIDKILEAKSGRHIPGILTAPLKRLICQEELNAILRHCFPRAGYTFAEAVLQHLNIDVECCGLEQIPEGSRYIFASNHPLGGLDGIALISILGRKYGDDGIRFPVNDMLMNVRPLDKIFMPINKYGAQGREAAVHLNEEYASERQIIIFPAGLVSRLGNNGIIRDLEWHKHFVAKATATSRLIVPVRVEALNALSFYRLARWRKRLGIKINLEQALLPKMLVKARSSKIRIIFGEPIHPATLPTDHAAGAQLIKDAVYKL